MGTDTARLYLAPVDSVPGAQAVFNLLVTPPGGSGPWQDLVDPIWISQDELMVMAAKRHLVNANCPFTCAFDQDRTPLRDTLQLGIEIARIKLTGASAVITPITDATDAIAWSADRSDGNLYLLIQRAPFSEVFHESTADTVYQVGANGGLRTFRYGVPRVGSEVAYERLHGVAAAAGRVFISRSWRSAVEVAGLASIPVGTALYSDIIEILPDGSTRLIAPAVSWRWGQLSISSDGRRLLAEAVERNGSDIYLIDVAP
jgi:hypothetical protein